MRTVGLLAYIVVAGLSALSSISLIGKDRKPATPGQAIAAIMFNALLLWDVLWLAGAY
jgi:hypothetical protein